MKGEEAGGRRQEAGRIRGNKTAEHDPVHPAKPLPAAWRRGAKFLILVGGLILLWKGILPATGNARGDFANYYTASKLVAGGISIEPAYSDFAWFQRHMDRVGIRGQVGGWTPHPPPTALLYIPLTPLDPVRARTLWTGINVLLLILNIWLLARATGLEYWLAALLMLACGYGLLNNFLFGQIYLLLTASILGGLELARRGRPVAAGIVLGSLVPVKYFGGFYVLYFAWKRQWKLVAASAASAAAVAAASLAAMGWPVWESFLTQVLPRHLMGEIQDPFSVAFQSWNSLLRRLFLFEETLNPHPLLQSPLAFFFLKSLIFWSLAGLCLLIFFRMRFADDEQQRLFELGWIPLVLLLLSPGSATYHFLLLSITAACWVRLALLQQRIGTVLSLAGLFAAVNMPHSIWLKPLAEGAGNLLAYPRLWLLTALGAAAVLAFRDQLRGRMAVRGTAVALLAGLVLLQAATAYWSYRERPSDAARRLEIEGEDYRRHLGLIVQSPSQGRQRTVFGYCALLDNRYRILTASGQFWGLSPGRNYFRPSLAADDESLLVETVVDGRSEIWLSPGLGAAPRPVVRGSSPAWHPRGGRFVFEQDGQLHFFDLKTGGQSPITGTEGGYDAAFSPDGEWVLYCKERARNGGLWRVRANTGEGELLDESGGCARPQVSSDGRRILFSSNQDIWMFDLASREAQRLTSNPAIDRDPIWDEENGRILFTSDRGRGLGCTTLFWMPMPSNQ